MSHGLYSGIRVGSYYEKLWDLIWGGIGVLISGIIYNYTGLILLPHLDRFQNGYHVSYLRAGYELRHRIVHIDWQPYFLSPQGLEVKFWMLLFWNSSFLNYYSGFKTIPQASFVKNIAFLSTFPLYLTRFPTKHLVSRTIYINVDWSLRTLFFTKTELCIRYIFIVVITTNFFHIRDNALECL